MSTRTPLVGALVAEGISFVGTRVSMIAIPTPLLGRVSSLGTAICWSLMPLGGVLGGVLGGLAVTGVGLSPALLVAGAAYFLTTMAPTRVPSFRRMDRAPAAEPAVPTNV